MKIEYKELHIEIMNSLKDIRETLKRVENNIKGINGKVGRNEKSIALIKGIGIATTTFVAIFGIAFHLLKG